VSGDFAYVTHEPGDRSGAPAKKGADADDDASKPPAQIALIDLKNFRVTRTIVSGHETEGVEFSRDGKTLLVTNEGDDTVSIYDSHSGAPMKTIRLIAGGRPRGIRAAPDGKSYVVTLESASKFVALDAGDFHVIKTVDTKLGPYGVSYDPSGQRLFVAASRDNVIQVFDAQTFEHLADVPVRRGQSGLGKKRHPSSRISREHRFDRVALRGRCCGRRWHVIWALSKPRKRLKAALSYQISCNENFVTLGKVIPGRLRAAWHGSATPVGRDTEEHRAPPSRSCSASGDVRNSPAQRRRSCSDRRSSDDSGRPWLRRRRVARVSA
jgi:hypothetical protein